MKTPVTHDIEQLELGFNQNATDQNGPGPERRIGRAAWWFAQMHRVVNDALDWRPARPGRPEQGWLPRISAERSA